MPVPRSQRSKGLRDQVQGQAAGRRTGADDNQVTVTMQRKAGPPVAPGEGQVCAPPGRGMQAGDRSARSASKFMSR